MLIEEKVYSGCCNYCCLSFLPTFYSARIKENVIAEMKERGWIFVGEKCYCPECKSKEDRDSGGIQTIRKEDDNQVRG